MYFNIKSIIAILALGSTFTSHSSSFAAADNALDKTPDVQPNEKFLRSRRTKETGKLIHASIEGDAVPDTWIVALKKEEAEVSIFNRGRYQTNLKGEFVQTKEQLSTLTSSYRGKLGKVFYDAMYGFEVTMKESDAARMAADPQVEYVEQVTVVKAIQQSPATWGIDRVDQRDLPLSNSYSSRTDGTGVTAYILDTGVQISHNEFKDASGQSRATWGINTSGDNDDRDCHGHGTHVAGTVGGLEYGVAKNVDIVAVKVLTCSGSGTTTGVIAGVNWAMNDAATNNNIAVANMSLGGGFSASLNAAVKNLHESGVLTAVAAGNDNGDACTKSPASEPAVITVGSTTTSDARSSFSNYGTCLDIFAPGSGITAAWIGSNSATNTISGTSMASPHVAGGLAIALAEGSTDAEGLVLNTATPGKVTNPQAGSPNKLLYVGNLSPGPPTAAPTPCASSKLKVSITTDNYPGETTWTLKNGCSGEELLSGGPYSASGTLYVDEVCTPDSLSDTFYEFTINDSYGDGLCCSYGSGSYKVEFDGVEKASGGEFTSVETKIFGNTNCASEPPISTECVWGVNSGDRIYYREGKDGSWQQISGRLKQVSVSNDCDHVWGVNSDDKIYYREGKDGSWQQIGGRLKHVSVSEDGSHVWGVNSDDKIYYRAGKNGSWQQIGGRLKQVSVSGDGSHVWGVNSSDNIYYRAGVNGSWQQIGGKLKHVSVSEDGSHVWGVNSSDRIYYRAGVNGSWQQIGGRLKEVSVSEDGNHVWGVNFFDNIYYRAGVNGSWQQIGGKLKFVSVGNHE